eukprot:1145823-Pelagomonas_calceolata.AAC.6
MRAESLNLGVTHLVIPLGSSNLLYIRIPQSSILSESSQFSILPADTAGPPNRYWNLESINLKTIYSGASTHHTKPPASCSSSYPACSTSASTTVLLASPTKEHPTFFPASLPY